MFAKYSNRRESSAAAADWVLDSVSVEVFVEVRDHQLLLACGAGKLVSGQETDLRISLPMKPMRLPISSSNGGRELHRCIFSTCIVITLLFLPSMFWAVDSNPCRSSAGW
jgi:hypothetical protein